MKYEIEFLAVGNGDKSGDAILIRWKESQDSYKVMVIDGGTKESGKKIVEHIKTYYETTHVDYVVNSHPDQDHASGLSVVLEELSVGELWIHRPWNYTKQIIDSFDDGRITENSLKVSLQKSFSYVYPLEELAIEKKIPIKEPYQGSKIGIFEVLSPKKDWYLYDLIPQFNKTPLAKSVFTETYDYVKETVMNWIDEDLHIETLSESGETSADNESSTILYAVMNKKGILLTGDAGVKALEKAYNYKPQIADNLKFIQVPHHGSRRNVSPSVLDNILGEKGQEENKTAFISASSNSSSHPRQSVINAFIRRGCKVVATKGATKRHQNGTPQRKGWTTVEPLKFQARFQE